MAPVLTEGGDVDSLSPLTYSQGLSCIEMFLPIFPGLWQFFLNLRLFTVRQIERSPQSNPAKLTEHKPALEEH